MTQPVPEGLPGGLPARSGRSASRCRRRSPAARARLRNYFLTGLVVAGPVAITIWITLWLINLIDGWVKPLIPPAWNPNSYLPVAVPGFGVLVAMIGLTILGFAHRQSRRPHGGAVGRERARPHADRAQPLQGREADLRDRLQAGRHQLPARRADRMAGAGPVVDLLHHRARARRARGRTAGAEPCLPVRALHAEPDDRLSGDDRGIQGASRSA